MVFFVLFFFFTLTFLLFKKDILNPAFIFVGVWGTGVFLATLFLSETTDTLFLCTFFIIISILLILPYFIARFNINYIRKFRSYKIFTSNCDLTLLHSFAYAGIGILLLFIYLNIIPLMRSYDSLRHYFYLVRRSALDGQPFLSQPWIVAQSIPFLMICSTFLLIEFLKNTQKKSNMILWLLSFVIFSIASIATNGTRSVFVFNLLSIVFIILSMSKINLKRIFYSAIVFIFIFSTSTYYLRLPEAILEKKRLLLPLLSHLFIYSFGGIVSFGVVANDLEPIFNALGGIGSLPFIDIGKGLSTNVFSAFVVFAHYLHTNIIRFLIVMLLPFVLQILHYFKYNSAFTAILWSYFCSALTLTVFHDYFFAIWPYWGRALILYFILYRLKPIRKIRRLFSRH